MATVQEFNTLEEAAQAAKKLRTLNAGEEVYVLANDKDAIDEIANRSDAATIGVDDVGLGTTIKNMFRGKSETLRAKMVEVGLSQSLAEKYEQRLDDGEILLIVTKEKPVI